jgi:hypothetical protein
MLVSILIYFTISFIPDVRFLLEVVHCLNFFKFKKIFGAASSQTIFFILKFFYVFLL